MTTKVVLGLQHGDEGKGRVVDDLVQTWADVVVRFQGGGNAGHTVYDEKGHKFVTRFDANSYLYLSKAMSYFDIQKGYGSLANAFKKLLFSNFSFTATFTIFALFNFS